MREECRAVVSQLMPRLVKLLLEEEEENATYNNCLKFALSRVESYSKPMSSSESVSHNLKDFLDRYQCEQLPIMAETVNTLSNVIIQDTHIDDNLKLALLDFLLSVNYKAFRSARIHHDFYMKRRVEILNALAEQRAQERLSLESPRQFDLASFRQALDNRISSDHESSPGSLDSYRRISDLRSSTTLSNIMTRGANNNDAQKVQQFQKLHDQPCQMVRSITLTRCSELGVQGRFMIAFGNYLLRKFHNVQHQLLLHGEEGFLMREVLSMFFLPGDRYYFRVVNHTIQLRPNTVNNNVSQQLVVDKFIKPMQHMQMMQLYIKCCEIPHDNGVRLETLTSLTDTLRRLIKPLVEALTQFEHNLDSDKCQLTLRDFRRATRAGFKSLELLWSLTASSYISYPADSGKEPHLRSHHIFYSLAEMTAQEQTPKEKTRRAYSATLLMNVLQIYCRFLDNWWKLGKFDDYQNEFPAKSIELNGCIEYVMRKYDNAQPYVENCPIYKIIKRHIDAAGAPLAALYNSKRLGNFVTEHKTMVEFNLHQAMVQSVHEQLKFYHQEIEKENDPAPDIFWQMKSTKDEQLRSLYNVYYRETMVDFSLPEFCHIDKMLKRCQNCVVYTPLLEIICQSFERFLDQRVMLLNRYVLYLLKDRVKLIKVLDHLRSVFLLLNFEDYIVEYTLVLGNLERGCVPKAVLQLQWILNKYNHQAPNNSCVFSVSMPVINLKQLSLLYSCDPIISSIVTESQLKSYNKAFRMRLELHVTMYRLKTLPHLPAGVQMKLIIALHELKSMILEALERMVCRPAIKKAASYFEDVIIRCEKLTHLQTSHCEFVEMICSILKLNKNGSQHELYELMTLARIAGSLWNRVEYVLTRNSDSSGHCSFNRQYEFLNMTYLKTVANFVRLLRCQQSLKDTSI